MTIENLDWADLIARSAQRLADSFETALALADGDTALYDVVVGAGARFTPTVEHKVLVVLSDGKDEGSSATLDDAIAAAQGIAAAQRIDQVLA